MNDGEASVQEAYSLDALRTVRWADLKNPRTGAYYEVKSAQAGRRFRLWRDQHRSLQGFDSQSTAWYAFVVKTSRKRDIKRMKPQTVGRLVRDRGGWNSSGHSRDALQHKLPVNEVFGRDP